MAGNLNPMTQEFTYNYHLSLHDNVQTLAANRDYWDEDDNNLYNDLSISGPIVGPYRRKWKHFCDHLKIKAIKKRIQ